jgi:basic membrane protein A
MNQELGGTAKSGFICGIRGPALERARYGFDAGSAYAGGECNVVYVGNFTDVAKGKEIAMQLYQEDLKLLQAFAGGAGLGAYQAAESMPEGYYAMGSADGHFHLSDRIIASMIQDNTEAYYLLIKQFASGSLQYGMMEEIKLSSGAIDFQYAPLYTDIIPQSIKDEIANIKAKIISGEITAPATEEEYNQFVAGL